MSTMTAPILAADRTAARRTRVACFPPLSTNPYQRLLYAALGEHGVELVGQARLKLEWLVRSRRRVDVLHFHWPEGYYRFRAGPASLRGLLSWLNLAAFAVRIAAARLLGYRIVWTVHQVVPHESHGAIDHVAARLLGRLAQRLVAHDRHTAEEVRRRLRREAVVIPHGSFVGAYPAGRGGDEARRELALERDDLVFLLFGHLRAYKDLGVVLDAWRLASLPHAKLIIAGMPDPGAPLARIESAASETRSIVALLDFVPDERVAELFEASDAAIVARSDGGTSGALVLALSFGLPVVYGTLPTYVELTGGESAGWGVAPGDPASLARTLAAVAADPVARRERSLRAQEAVARLDWGPISAATARVLAP
jgi:glycosyltransferase involved in cell wall biosynthesis